MSIKRRLLSLKISVFSLLVGILLVFGFDPVNISLVFAMGKTLPYDDLHITRCLTQQIDGSFSPDASRYKLSGICTVFLDRNPYKGGETGESTFENEKPIHSLIWVAETHYTPSNKATWEKIDLLYKDDHRFTMGLESRMACERDPWRTFLTKPCESIFDTPKGEMPPSLLIHLRQSQTGIPFTAILDSNQRTALDKKYHVSLALQQKSHNSVKIGPPTTVRNHSL